MRTFIASGDVDLGWSRWLAGELVELGLTVSFMESVGYGAPIVETLDMELAACQAGVIVLSATAWLDARLRSEVEVLLRRSWRDGVRVLVALRDHTPMPPTLADRGLEDVPFHDGADLRVRIQELAARLRGHPVARPSEASLLRPCVGVIRAPASPQAGSIRGERHPLLVLAVLPRQADDPLLEEPDARSWGFARSPLATQQRVGVSGVLLEDGDLSSVRRAMRRAHPLVVFLSCAIVDGRLRLPGDTGTPGVSPEAFTDRVLPREGPPSLLVLDVSAGPAPPNANQMARRLVQAGWPQVLVLRGTPAGLHLARLLAAFICEPNPAPRPRALPGMVWTPQEEGCEAPAR